MLRVRPAPGSCLGRLLRAATFERRQVLWNRKVDPALGAVRALSAVTPRQSSADADQAPSSYPTFVPRNPGVTDGVWNPKDGEIVRQAQKDAEEVAKAGAGASAKAAASRVILGKSEAELLEVVSAMGEAKYRARQLKDGVLKTGARSVDELTLLPKAFREALKAGGYRTGRSVLHHSVKAADGTQKLLLQLADGRVVETVGIPLDDDSSPRLTVCVSSQVGCPMRCTFCATGKGGFARNLSVHEIVDQVLTVQEVFGRRVSNVVFMGMGEPLLNLPNVIGAFDVLNKDVGIGARMITISTVGVPQAIRRLAGHNIKATLAVSIHAPSQALREQLIPSAKAYPLEALMEDCAAYFAATGRRVTYEYTLLSGVNDEAAHARQLGELLRRYDLASHVNVIPWNPVDESEFKRPANSRINAFKRALEEQGVPVSVRVTRGLEAAAACGQLRNQYQKEPLAEFQLPG